MKHPVTTMQAYLPCHGLNNRRATLHLYSHSELVTLTTDGRRTTGLAHMFKCNETGEIRRWGFDVTFAKDNGGN